MAYYINPDETDQCVRVSYEGEMPSVELAAARTAANSVLGERDWLRLLVDLTKLRTLPTPAQLFDHTKAITAEVRRGVRVAVLVRPDQVHAARLVERIARSDGVFLAYFLDPDKAKAWVKPVKVPRHALGHNWRRIHELV